MFIHAFFLILIKLWLNMSFLFLFHLVDFMSKNESVENSIFEKEKHMSPF